MPAENFETQSESMRNRSQYRFNMMQGLAIRGDLTDSARSASAEVNDNNSQTCGIHIFCPL